MASEMTLEQKTWHQLECAANSVGGIEVAMVSLPIAQVKALVEGRNTRPAPAATDTGLVTVGYAHRGTIGLLLKGAVSKAVIVPNAGGDFKTPVMLVEQAEELLAAERAKVRHWQEQYTEMHSQFLDLAKSAEADNAAERAEKELEADLKTYQDDTTDEVNEKIDLEFKVVDLEAKLAAAENALEPFAAHANDRAVDDTGWRDKETVKIVVSIGDLRKARAVLGGKP